ncbi:acyl-CoA thioesterase [Roseiterribacter gracilis]|uniref:4-hydroxybenzoyl-CoA thioesterase n=1 Tax=Roseiterribacter gracilis TaxID=2812848 RepID=A0A8S8XEH7_9PROT|nr:4-hydroxybenzoyl-CoA thioesterase [Rhodospirillales bacterium TMPK1]
MSFTTDITVRFAHVDAAGIVFFPRYFEMVNQTVEEWFEAELGTSFHQLHLEGEHGVPAVRIETDFVKASRLGDRLRFALDVTSIGRSRVDLRIVVSCRGEERVRIRLVVAFVSLEPLQSCPIPDALRAAMEKFLVPQSEPS